MTSQSVLGFIFGAALGACAGILFAPAKGEETRQKLLDAASEGYDQAKEGFDELSHEANVRYRYARIEANKLKKTLMEQGGELKEEARKVLMEQLAKLEAAINKDEKVAEEEA